MSVEDDRDVTAPFLGDNKPNANSSHFSKRNLAIIGFTVLGVSMLAYHVKDPSSIFEKTSKLLRLSKDAAELGDMEPLADIYGETALEGLGYSVSISDKARYFVASSPRYGTWGDKGVIRLFERDGESSSTYTEIAVEFGATDGIQFGYSSAIDPNGKLAVVGAIMEDSSKGCVHAYSMKERVELGAVLSGDTMRDQFGYSVSITDYDGNPGPSEDDDDNFDDDDDDDDNDYDYDDDDDFRDDDDDDDDNGDDDDDDDDDDYDDDDDDDDDDYFRDDDDDDDDDDYDDDDDDYDDDYDYKDDDDDDRDDDDDYDYKDDDDDDRDDDDDELNPKRRRRLQRFHRRRKLETSVTRLAAGAPALGSTAAPYAKVYELFGSDWKQIGETLKGPVGSGYGASVALDYEGNELIVGIPLVNKVQVYALKGGTYWANRGSAFRIDGTTDGSAGTQCGKSVDITQDGRRVVVGCKYYDTVNTYFWSESDYLWKRYGNGIKGPNNGFGYSVSIDKQGKKLMIGNPYKDSDLKGEGVLYVWNGSASDWTKSTTFTGASGSKAGWSVSLAQDGKSFACGCPEATGNGQTKSGHTAIFADSK